MLPYGSESSVVMGETLKVLEGFNHRSARSIAGMVDWRAEDGEWEYPLMADAMEAAGLWKIKE